MKNRSSDTPKRKRGLKRAKTPCARRCPISPATAKLMALCEAKRTMLEMTYADVGRGTDVGRSDVSAALRLREEPTTRTVRALVAYFKIGRLSSVSLKQRELALLIELEASLAKLADGITALRRLREKKK